MYLSGAWWKTAAWIFITNKQRQNLPGRILSVVSDLFKQIVLSDIAGLSECVTWLYVLADNTVDGEMGRYRIGY